MADGEIRIVLPRDVDAETLARLREAFPEASLASAAPPGAADGAELGASLGGAQPAETTLAVVEGALAKAAAAAPEALASILAWFGAHPALFGLIALLIGLAAGHAVERAVGALVASSGGGGPVAPDSGGLSPFRARLRAALPHLLRSALALAAFAGVGFAVGRAILPGDASVRAIAAAAFLAIVGYRVKLLMVEALAAPSAPSRRLMGFGAAEAASVLRAARIALAGMLALTILRAVVVGAASPPGSAALLVVALLLLSGALAAWFFSAVRRPVAALIARDAAAPSFAARNWWAVYVGVVALDVGLKSLGALGLLGPAQVGGGGPTVVIMMLAPLAVAGLSLWRREADAEADSRRRSGLLRGGFALAEGIVVVVAAVAVLRIWGVDPLAPPAPSGVARFAPALVEAGAILVVGLALWRALSAALDPGPAAAPGAIVDEENQAQSSRMGTILPVVRGFALGLVAVLTAMSALSAMGLDIAPLLASAGVLGLAIGFGAQKLVSDVISGLFYLYEDAFRVGEYVEAKSGKGVVERISLRSVRLRHHRGPVFTIPFSEMGTIQNHSRDWVKVKFSFMVPSDVDVEMVRKLVKKVGEQLLDHPELQGKFLEPLKSQGAVAILGSAFEIGCKFTSRPGQQFIIRRMAYAALQKTLAEKGVELFQPQLTLAADDPGGASMGMPRESGA
ncbi:Small-conductance mechanosensitive channel [Rubrimonas cliftonensis]|uniref:Small-conductance mechanosensitive channel n=1 Tax=Rubrimonas cliftonensis TaxID=89524 RepID=A0A1H3YFM4_9RHOB|nr:Small-conductance mechanosensitive channel [Rubrimonas cliftonensis]